MVPIEVKEKASYTARAYCTFYGLLSTVVPLVTYCMSRTRIMVDEKEKKDIAISS